MPSSIQFYARVAGALLLLSIVAGGFGEGYAPSQLIAPNDAAATAHNIVASNALFRVGFATYLVEGVCNVALAAILYALLRPVDRVIALVSAFFHLMAAAVFAFGELFYFVPSLIVGGDSYLKSFSFDQLDALVLLSLNVYGLAGEMSLVFYGLGLAGFGYLIFRSGYLPAWLGILLVIGGIGFVLREFTLVLAANYSPAVLQLIAIAAILALAIWLLAKGVDRARWEARARARRSLAAEPLEPV